MMHIVPGGCRQLNNALVLLVLTAIMPADPRGWTRLERIFDWGTCNGEKLLPLSERKGIQLVGSSMLMGFMGLFENLIVAPDGAPQWYYSILNLPRRNSQRHDLFAFLQRQSNLTVFLTNTGKKQHEKEKGVPTESGGLGVCVGLH